MIQRQKPALEKMFKALNVISKVSIQGTQNVTTHFCELFFPRELTITNVPNVFNNDSQKVRHLDVPDKKKNLIVIGLFGDTYRASDQTFDNMSTESPYILTHKDEKLPVGTKIRIYRERNMFLMRIQEHFVYPSVGEKQVYFKNMIVPFN